MGVFDCVDVGGRVSEAMAGGHVGGSWWENGSSGGTRSVSQLGLSKVGPQEPTWWGGLLAIVLAHQGGTETTGLWRLFHSICWRKSHWATGVHVKGELSAIVLARRKALGCETPTAK